MKFSIYEQEFIRKWEKAHKQVCADPQFYYYLQKNTNLVSKYTGCLTCDKETKIREGDSLGSN